MIETKRIDLTDDGRVNLTPYVLDFSPELPLSVSRPAVVVIPGGGYQGCSDREGEPVAMAFAAQGFNTFVLRYSVGKYASFPNPLIDLMKTMKIIRDHAEEWHTDPGKIAVVGFSAGGHLVASLGVYWNDEKILAKAGVKASEAKPNALILCYPVISSGNRREPGTIATAAAGHDEPDIYDVLSLEKHVGPHTPPCYIAHTFFDSVVPVENSLLFASALAENNVPFELHVTQDGVHGLSVADHVTSIGPFLHNSAFSAWVKGSGEWMKKLFEFKAPPDFEYETALRRTRKFDLI
ncbi:MAG: alpha/beta hydrolase [Clostridia bacterium]|nr:alpha/beta hydrolase [Clostridia bacterium]